MLQLQNPRRDDDEDDNDKADEKDNAADADNNADNDEDYDYGANKREADHHDGRLDCLGIDSYVEMVT